MPPGGIKLIRSIRICKTPQLGAIVYTCKKCNKKHYVYKSCGNSQCMLCQSIKREQWVDKLKTRMLQVPYVHMVFTLPHEFNGLCRNNQIELYSLVMRSAWQTVREIFKLNDVEPGMTSVLHTFGSSMSYHIHVHALVTYGGINHANEWIYPDVNYGIERYRKVCAVWKRIVLENIQTLFTKNKLVYHENYETVTANTQKTRWVVHTTRPTAHTETIEKYLAKYINRIGISDSRVQYLKDHSQVIIQYNDYKAQQQNQAAPKAFMMMEPLVFIHQILQHVLPRYFQKSRNYGLHKLSKANRDTIPEVLKRNGVTVRTLFQIISQLMGLDTMKCDNCGQSEFAREELLPNRKWILSYLTKNTEGRSPPQRKTHIKSQILTIIPDNSKAFLMSSKSK